MGDKYYAVATSHEWGPLYPVLESNDLNNWKRIGYVFPDAIPEWAEKNFWAPEIFYDEVTDKYLIFWSSTLTPGSTNDHRVYYISTEDFVTYTDTALFYDPGWSCIDAYIAKDGDRYAMVLKDERDSGKNIRITFSDHAAGPYDVPPSDSITPGGLWVEGPSMVKIGQEWILYYDAYTLLLDALEQVGTVEKEQVAAALATTKNFEGVTGVMTINENHDMVKPVVIMTVKDGRFQWLDTVQPY